MDFNPVMWALCKQSGGGSGGGGSSAPADWNAKEGEAGYVKNRTHWEEVKYTAIIDNKTLEYDTSSDNAECSADLSDGVLLEHGDKVTVVFDGVTYDNLPCDSYEGGWSVSLYDSGEYLGYVEVGYWDGKWYFYSSMLSDMLSDAPTHTVSIYADVPVVHHLDPKYVKDMYYDTIAEAVSISIENVTFDSVIKEKKCAKLDGNILEFMAHPKTGAYPFADLTINGETKRIYNDVNGRIFISGSNGTDASGRAMQIDTLSIVDNDSRLAVYVDRYSGEMHDGYEEGCFLFVDGIDHNGITDISFTVYDGEIKKIDPKYLPELTSVVLKSSTEGSDKKFRVTVDDNGTLTATEV